MKKNDFKKMALLGMTGGMLLSSQTPVSAQVADSSGIILAHSCGSGSCNNKRSCGGQNQQSQPATHSCAQHNPNRYTADSDREVSAMTTGHRILTESELKSQLNSDTKRVFDGMSPEGKALALKLANQDCKGKNDCKGQNACKTEKNSCAGLGGCKGTSPAPFKDKNSAVKVAAKYMAEKRAKANGSM